jgi:ribose transport system substrate-binding protein
VQSILTTPIKMDKAQMMAAIPEDCSEDSDAWYHVGVEAWAGKAFLDQFFLRPADPEAYKAENHPKKQ